MFSLSSFIEEYLKDGTYRGLVSKFSRKSNKNLLDLLDSELSSNGMDISRFTVSQKLYHYINNIYSIPNCYCGNSLNYKNISIGYYNYCSNSCQVSSQETQNKIKQTSIERYGEVHHTKRESIRESMSKRYDESDYGFGKDKFKESMIDKYGVDNISKLDKVKKSKSEKWKNMDDSYKKELIEKRSKLSALSRRKSFINKMNDLLENNGLKFLDSNKYETLSKENYGEYTMFCDDCGKEFKILKSCFYKRQSLDKKICTNCNPTDIHLSNPEDDIYDFLKSIYKGSILRNDRKLLNGKELDFYIPQFKLAIEFNGIYWHSELFKDKNYHLDKTNLCEKFGIKLIHIYEDDWVYKQDIVKSRILNILGKCNRIYARKCEIREISDNRIIRQFLNHNHIQGFVPSKVKIGLFFEEELVSLMTFGNLRRNLGNSSKKDHYELLRFCNKLNTTVIGGASKLFKYFIRNYNPKYILSYADRSWSSGDLYEKLKFNFSHNTYPNFYYTNGINRLNRFNFRKDKLVSEGYDPSKTEHEIMLERKYYRIYDSGSKKYEYISLDE